jgi:hypothetical protein
MKHNTDQNVDLSKSKNVSQQQQQQQQHEITYSLDSADESIVVDTLINNPTQLKQKLKQSKMDREQLTQLQENYLRLLEQYAEAENFIDTFRLGAHTKSNSNLSANTPSLNMFQVRINFLNKV